MGGLGLSPSSVSTRVDTVQVPYGKQGGGLERQLEGLPALGPAVLKFSPEGTKTFLENLGRE